MKKYVIVLFCCSSLWAVNQLSIQDPNVYGSKPGYIDQATLVVEPHGAFVEQSLYLHYSDHHLFSTQAPLEVVHRFELPAGSVVNDMWLWIGDSVMQAVCMDTWSARAIYDSIVSYKRDPAFLSKKGDQYELHVYPLLTGLFRKVKLNFITPTRWQGTAATAVLPLRMLQVNSGLPTPLTILFRERSYLWDDPQLLELPQNRFKILPDTLDYHFRMAVVEDLSPCSSLTLTFGLQFPDGFYYNAHRFKDDEAYYQLGLLPSQLFQVAADTSRKKILLALDLNSPAGESFEQPLTALSTLLANTLTSRDQFDLVVTGADQSFTPGQGWQWGTAERIQDVMNQVRHSAVFTQLAHRRPPHIFYADEYAMQCWSFPGMEKLATREVGRDIVSGRNRFQYADVIAAYSHGHETVPSQQQIALVVASLDSFFQAGGRLLSFYDYNRVGVEELAAFYVPGLTTREKISGSLYRNLSGRIGAGFPAEFHHPVANILEYNDPKVAIEVQDGRGRPVVISKKIKNGLLVVSGIWSFKDDAAMRSLLSAPLLGLNRAAKGQLPQLLTIMAERFSTEPFDRGIIASFSDSLLIPEQARAAVEEYLKNFQPRAPMLHTITLLTGQAYTPPAYVEDGLSYYGSGYWLKSLSAATNGQHFERHLCDWDYIAGQLSGGTGLPALAQLEVTAASGASGVKLENRRIGPVSSNSRQPVFFIGSAPLNQAVRFQVQAEFVGSKVPVTREINLPPAQDSSSTTSVLPAMLANEWINEKLDNASFDTVAIVDLAKKYNLLCDYTALIALEPNDTLQFMKRPFDESKLPATPVEHKTVEMDTVALEVYPNPFNSRTCIQIHLPDAVQVSIMIYNMRGQLVREVLPPSVMSGQRRFLWDGGDAYGRQTSSGLYFIRVLLNEKYGSRQILRRVLLLR